MCFSKHLSLAQNKESDFETFFAYLRRNDKFVNCQGLVVDWFSHNPQHTSFSYSWSHELLHLPSYGLNALVSPQEKESAAKLAACISERDQEKAEKQALEKKLSDLYAQLNREKNDQQALEKRVSDLHEQLNRDNKDKKALKKQVIDLTSKLEEFYGVRDGLTDEKPWMNNNEGSFRRT